MSTIAETLAQAKAFHRAGQLEQAVACYQQVLGADASRAEAHFLLGAAWREQGRLNEAIECLTEAIRLEPSHAEAHHQLGAALAEQGKLDEAITSLEQALRLLPESADISQNLRLARASQENHDGNRLASRGQYDEAAAHCRRALEWNPRFAEAHNSLGAILQKQGRFDEAVDCCRRAVELSPELAEAHYNLGVVWDLQGRLGEAEGALRRAIELKPDFAEAYFNLGVVLRHQGKADEATASFRTALQIRPQFSMAHSNALAALHYQPHITLADLAAAHREFEEQHAAPLRAAWRAHDNSRDPDRKLRLGFVSADLGYHPVGYFLVRALENLDRRQVDTVCYNDRLAVDAMTVRLREAATDWRESRALDDEQLAEQIRGDRIDIAFDLSGHCEGNRLLAFARKPAPIAVTWIGYVGTTGLRAIDYLLADRYEVPEAAESSMQERVLCMNDGYVCYDPPSHAPAVSPLPAFERGTVTFGSFNNLAKITPQVIEVWATILRRVRGSRLVLKYLGLSDPSVTQRFTDLFAAQGIGARRLELLGWSSHVELLGAYQRIDVALDPFPFSGGLTTCEALWMGVPVVTCPGETFASRHSLSHLSNVGLTETIANNRDAYVTLATGLATDLPRLAGIRGRLRQQVADSPLCNGRHFADNLINVVRGAWRQWCDK